MANSAFPIAPNFGTVSVSGQSDLIASTPYGTLTLAKAGAVTLTTSRTAGVYSVTVLTSTIGDLSGPSASTDSELPLFDGTSGKLLKRSNTLTGAVSLDAGVVSAGVIPVSLGGTGLSSATAYGTLCAGATSADPFQVVGPGTANYILTSNGAGALPSYSTSIDSLGTPSYLATYSPSSATSSDITLTSGYTNYLIIGMNVRTSFDGDQLQLRTSSDGTTYDSGANYSYGGASNGGSSTSSGQTTIPLSGGSIGNAAGEACNFRIVVYSPATTAPTRLHADVVWTNNLSTTFNTQHSWRITGVHTVSAVTQKVRLLFASGTMTGTIYVYGIN